MPAKLVNLSDDDLFGNDAAEDEDEDIFASYVVPRVELENFASTKHRIRIIRAYRGEGKSATLRLAKSRIVPNGDLVIHTTAMNLAPSSTIDDPVASAKQWSDAIIARLAAELGKTIGIPTDGDATSLVEFAQASGSRPRSLISLILERVSLQSPISVQSRSKEPDAAAAAGAALRAMENKRVWLLVDDVDQDFQATKVQQARVAGFFIACRDLVNRSAELFVRTAIRPNVFAIVQGTHESIGKVEQYCLDVDWSEADIKDLIFHRIRGYLERRGRIDEAYKRLGAPVFGDQRIVDLVFEPEMIWGDSKRPVHTVLYTLSKRRPRWVIEIAKAAARVARSNRHEVIGKKDIGGALQSFGESKIKDLVSEFKFQYGEIRELVYAFHRQKEEMSSEELFTIIITQAMKGKWSGGCRDLPPGARQRASKLFEIGFIYARRSVADGKYEHLAFHQLESLTELSAAQLSGLRWEVHPAFRQALGMRDADGRVTTTDYGRGRGRGAR